MMIRQEDYRSLDWGNIKAGGSIGMLSLFKDLSSVISRKRRDAIWNLIVRRYHNAREICNFKEI